MTIHPAIRERKGIQAPAAVHKPVTPIRAEIPGVAAVITIPVRPVKAAGPGAMTEEAAVVQAEDAIITGRQGSKCHEHYK